MRRVFRNIAIAIGLTLFLLIQLEGVSSALLFGWRLGTAGEERSGTGWQHAQHDAELGWAHTPNIEIKDLYGPGLGLQTNSQGFRNSRDFPVPEAAGRVRVICSGDSFTLGYGVGDADTWCAQLGAIDPRLEPVNMGQIAYGVGQAYLWYMRDGRPLDHSVHLLAVISVDFERMMRDEFRGIRKPRLTVVDGELVVENVPIPPPEGHAKLARAREQVGNLRFIQLARGLLRRAGAMGDEESSAAGSASWPDSGSGDVMARILDSLLEVNEAKGSTLALVYLPVGRDLYGPADVELTARWRRFLAEEARKRDLVYIDLIPDLRQYPPAEVDRMFIPRDAGAGRGHLSVFGNSVVAEKIYERLVAVPELSARLPSPSTSD